MQQHEDAALAAIAVTQRGRFTRRQARDCGFGGSTIGRRVADAVWREPLPGVLVPAGSPTEELDELVEAVLWARSGRDALAASARRSAARIHGLLGRSATRHVVVPFARCPDDVPAGVVRHRSRRLVTDRIVVVDGVPTTDVPWTVADLAFDEPVRVVRDVAARAIRRGQATRESLEAELDRLTGTTARTVLRRVLGSLGAQTHRARSDAELRVADGAVGRGLPEPVLNHEVVDAGGRVVAELDLAWVELRVAVEIDEYEWHADPSRKRRDDVKQNRLLLRGWRILRFTTEDVRDRLPWVLDTIESALSVAAASV